MAGGGLPHHRGALQTAAESNGARRLQAHPALTPSHAPPNASCSRGASRVDTLAGFKLRTTPLEKRPAWDQASLRPRRREEAGGGPTPVAPSPCWLCRCPRAESCLPDCAPRSSSQPDISRGMVGAHAQGLPTFKLCGFFFFLESLCISTPLALDTSPQHRGRSRRRSLYSSGSQVLLQMRRTRELWYWAAKTLKSFLGGSLGGSAVEHLPSAQGVILGSRDRAPHRAPCREPALPLPVSLPLSLCLS